MNRLRTATFTVHGTTAQSARWKHASEADGFTSAGQWLAAAADAYLRARARAGQPLPLAWRRGRFTAQLEGGAELVLGHVAPPFAVFHGDSRGPARRGSKRYTLVHLPGGRPLGTFRYFHDCKALAADLARQWVREEGHVLP